MRSAFALAVLCGTLAAQTPSPGPEYRPLEALVGEWRLDGVLKAAPAVGATDEGPVAYRHVNQMTNGGYFLETRRTGTGPRGDVSELWIFSYSPLTKQYRMDGYTSRGATRAFTFTITDRTWTFKGTNTSQAGVTTQERFTIVYAADMRSATVRSEHSKDGAEWFERLTGKYTRR